MDRHSENILFTTDDIVFAAIAQQCLNDLNEENEDFFHMNIIQTQVQIM
jgi:hypothetical protein